MTSRPQAGLAWSVTARSLGAGASCRPAQARGSALATVIDELRAGVLLHWRALLFLFALGGTSHASAAGDERTATEASVKAAYLYKFASYVEWPPASFARADAPFIIGVIGANPIVAELNRIKASVSAAGRPLDVRELRPGETLNGVHLLFLGLSDVKGVAKLLSASASQPVLTVTDASGAMEAGSIINFVEVGNHIRFEVSLPHADRAGIKVSVRLLNVAHKIVMRKS